MAAKEPFGFFDTLRRQKYIFTKPLNERMSSVLSDSKADIVTHDCTQQTDEKYLKYVEMTKPSKKSSRYQYRFSGRRDAKVLECNKPANARIAILADDRLKRLDHCGYVLSGLMHAVMR